VASRLGAGVEQVLEALRAADAYRLMSLDEPLAEGAGALEAIGGDDAGFELAEHRVLLRRGLDSLGAREREIVRLRFYEGLTQREIARAVGVSQMHVSRLIRRSIDAMRDTIEPVARAA
jgi:RNA polymerase sigma-B factor